MTPVHRTTDLLLPTGAVAREAVQLVETYRITRVIYGALAPLALLAPRLRRAGVQRQLGITHGHEVWWATMPGARRLLRRMGDDLDRISVISDYTRSRIESALSPAARGRIIELPPAVDCDRFGPAAAGTPAADGAGVADVADTVGAGRVADADADGPDGSNGSTQPRLRCIAVGRMVRQKGHDVLLDAWQTVAGMPWPSRPELILVGDGPRGPELRRQVARRHLSETVSFVGSMDRRRVAGLLAAGTVFALPVRTRLAGLQPEGFGRVFIEAAASGLPVIAGRSGGAAETLVPGETGFLVDPSDPAELAARIVELFRDPGRATRMGRAGRQFVIQNFSTGRIRGDLRQALGIGPDADKTARPGSPDGDRSVDG